MPEEDLINAAGARGGHDAIASYRVSDLGARFAVLDAGGVCVWLGLREPRAVLEIVGPSEAAEVLTGRSARRARDIKRPNTSRRYTVEVRDARGQRLGRVLRFRRESDAERMAARIRLFAGHRGAD